MPISEALKKELSFSINDYNEPKELRGPKAWAQLIKNLLYMKKGSYPSCPDMGIDLASYDFEFLDNVKTRLRNEIISQAQQYYPEIPLVDFQIDSKLMAGYSSPIVYMILTFYYEGTNNSVVIAATESKSMIDFGISM